jgi:indole-3-glycerol phosphate synthase
VTGSRRLSQALSEGDGISVLVNVADAAGAAAAEEQGAEGLVLDRAAPPGLRDATELPVLYRGDSPDAARAAGADAWVLIAEHHHDEGSELEEQYARALGLGLECVIDVRDEEELELVLERIDPEIFLLSPREADDGEEALDRVLELLPDVPAGKLAIAEVAASTREEVVSLERAGVDAVLIGGGDVAHLVGGPVPEV